MTVSKRFKILFVVGIILFVLLLYAFVGVENMSLFRKILFMGKWVVIGVFSIGILRVIFNKKGMAEIKKYKFSFFKKGETNVTRKNPTILKFLYRNFFTNRNLSLLIFVLLFLETPVGLL
jgi:hypothetical protein